MTSVPTTARARCRARSPTRWFSTRATSSVQNILTFMQRADASATLADAQAFNRSLGASLNRNVAIKEESISPDVGLKASLGNRFELPRSTQIGFMLGGTYDNVWRETQRTVHQHHVPRRANRHGQSIDACGQHVGDCRGGLAARRRARGQRDRLVPAQHGRRRFDPRLLQRESRDLRRARLSQLPAALRRARDDQLAGPGPARDRRRDARR